MVLLKQESPVKQNQPMLQKWDQLRRQHYNQYEKQIQQKEFHLQKFQQSKVYSMLFPFFCQGAYLDLDILKKLQVLGDYNEEEINHYQQLQPNIKNHLNNTFSRTFPFIGLAVGICLQAVPYRFNYSLSHHLGLLIAPMITEQVYKKFNLSHKHNTLMFLESTLNRRIAQAILEKDQHFISKQYLQQYQKNFGNTNLAQIYKTYLAM